MANHVLSLEAPDTLNKCQLRLVDTSVYNVLSPVTCPSLEVTVPGFKDVVEIPNVEPGFIYNLTACDLKLQSSGCGTTFLNLPDGIYILKYSVSPNDQVYVEYNHLRITLALDKIQKIYCDLDVANCDPSVKIKEKLLKVREIRDFLYAAKAKVEYCGNPRTGMQIYNYAVKLLDKLTCKTC